MGVCLYEELRLAVAGRSNQYIYQRQFSSKLDSVEKKDVCEICYITNAEKITVAT